MREWLIVAMFAVAAPAHADWAAVPLDVLVDEADVMVVGKVAKIQDGGFAIGSRKYDVAVVAVSDVLKSASGKPKEIHIAQPGMGMVTSADIRFSAGQQGIWLLTKDPERDVYWAKHPGQFQVEKEQKELMTLLEARSKVAGGTPTKGLVARAELIESPAHFQVRFSLKNVTEKPITFCEYVGHQPVQVKWIGPDGFVYSSKHYNWLKAARIAALDKRNFVVIQSGGVHFINHPVKFVTDAAKAGLSDNVALIGENKITVSYTSNEEGKPFGLENVWTGTVTAKELTLSVK